MSISIRQIIGNGESQVIGCDLCGCVEHLVGNSTHSCNRSDPFAITIDAGRLKPAEPAKSQH